MFRDSLIIMNEKQTKVIVDESYCLVGGEEEKSVTNNFLLDVGDRTCPTGWNLRSQEEKSNEIPHWPTFYKKRKMICEIEQALFWSI